MSVSRPRTGLKRPREVEKELLGARWRESGAALSTATDRREAKLRSQALAASEAWGVDLTGVPIPARNVIANGLLQLAMVTGDEVFQEAFDVMRRKGLDGPDGMAKADAMMPMSDAERGVAAFVEARRAMGGAERAMEQAAAQFAVPSSSFDSAVQAVKRTWLRVTRR